MDMDQLGLQLYDFEPEGVENHNDISSDNSDEEDLILEGRAETSDWCNCGNKCRPMASDEESFCCCENKKVRIVKTVEHRCVTENPSLDKSILDLEILAMVRHSLAIKTQSEDRFTLLTAAVPSNKTCM